jgi:hypothetical protein
MTSASYIFSRHTPLKIVQSLSAVYSYSFEKWEIEIDTGPFIFDAIQFYLEIVDIPVTNMK